VVGLQAAEYRVGSSASRRNGRIGRRMCRRKPERRSRRTFVVAVEVIEAVAAVVALSRREIGRKTPCIVYRDPVREIFADGSCTNNVPEARQRRIPTLLPSSI